MKIMRISVRISPLLFVLPGLFGCAEPITQAIDPPNEYDMVWVRSQGQSTLMGSTSAYAKSQEESPRLRAGFTYDFWMDSAEVTQGEYQSVTGRELGDARFGKGDDLPVYHVTFYDAVLYCNARSKKHGLDTVYSYQQAVFDSAGKAVELRSLHMDYSKRGFRLPTEAEWEFAARAGVRTTFAWGDEPDASLAVDFAWTLDNSDNKAHAVKSKKPNPFGIYDMLGNVMEWVNDWKGPLAETEVKDFLGNRDPGVVQERSIKGGSFAYELRYTRFSARSEIYPALSSMSKPYIGFRCVLAPIESGRYLMADGKQNLTPAVFHHYDAVKRLMGHDQVKLVFVNLTLSSRTLVYADFSSPTNRLIEFHDDTKVHHPVISPDGQWVAYGNREEGDSREGQIFLRRLSTFSPPPRALGLPAGAAIPRWWVDPVASDTFLVYASSAVGNQDAAWNSSSTYRIQIKSGVSVGQPILLTQGGFHDGLSADGKWLATGYQRIRLANLGEKTQSILFASPANGKKPQDTSQVCNVSISPSGLPDPQLLILDFGYPESSAVVGRSYGLHEILFRLDLSGEVAKIYEKPQGFEAWQDVEWSNHPDYAAGLGQTSNADYPAVIGLDLEKDRREVLASGSQLRQPYLWVNPNRVLWSESEAGMADSLGRYNEPLADYSQEVFAEKMRTFWLQRKNVEVVGLGTSHLAFGMVPLEFKSRPAMNFASPGAIMGSQFQLLHQYVLPHTENLKAVIFDVLLGNLFYDFELPPPWFWAKGFQYDKHHGFWQDSLPARMEAVMRYERTMPVGLMHDTLGGGGHHIFPGEGFSSGTPLTFMQGSGALPDSVVAANLRRLRSLAEHLDSLGVAVVFALLPESPHYAKTPLYLKHGPKREYAQQMLGDLKSVCADLPACRFYDAHLEGRHDFKESEFADDDHLNVKGARRLSARLDSLVNVLIGQRR